MSHSLNRSHIRLAYFQPMASCLADGFLSIKINLLELAGLKTHKKIQMPAGIMEMHPQAYLEEPPALPAAPLL